MMPLEDPDSKDPSRIVGHSQRVAAIESLTAGHVFFYILILFPSFSNLSAPPVLSDLAQKCSRIVFLLDFFAALCPHYDL